MSRSRPSVVGKLGIAGIVCGSLIAAGLSGCGGSSDPFSYKKISGKVTYDDGSLIQAPRLQLSFKQIDPPVVEGNKYPRPGSAEVNVEDGTFDSVTSHTYGDGLVPGRYKVTIKAEDKNQKPLALVPPEYLDVGKTPLEFDTKDAPWTITVKKPAVMPKR